MKQTFPLDRQKLEEILSLDHSFYGGPGYETRIDARLNPSTRDLIASQFTSDMRVLDIGCGRGLTLIDHHDQFTEGVGIDNDAEHLGMAEANKEERNVTNVDFMLIPAVEIPQHLDKESFDFVFTERGPLGGTSSTIQAALYALRAGGLIFSETIGELHHQEVREVFGSGERHNQAITVLDQAKVAMERNGVRIRLAADLVSKRYYPDIYEWLKFQCSIWTYAGRPLPSLEDIDKLQLFAERNTTSQGEIETTHHVVWVGGIKLESPPNYGEYQHFESDGRRWPT